MPGDSIKELEVKKSKVVFLTVFLQKRLFFISKKESYEHHEHC